jgi:hypothetical protein
MTGPESSDKTPPTPRPPKRRAGNFPAPPANTNAPPPLPEFTVTQNTDASETDDHNHNPIVDALANTAALSVYSSISIHLFLLLSTIIVIPLLGLDITELLTEEQPPLQAALGEEPVSDDAASFDLVAELPSNNTPAQPNPQQLAARLQNSDAAWLKSSVDDIWNNTSAARGNAPNPADDTGNLLKIPEGGLAVTKGSFTAFTIPAKPVPKQSYLIVIEVKLPNDTKTYRVSDLSGNVKGSDGFEQKLPTDSRFASAAKYPDKDKFLQLKADTVLNAENNKVQIIIRVPGGARLVRDQITIRSRKLRESQKLDLIFSDE